MRIRKGAVGLIAAVCVTAALLYIGHQAGRNAERAARFEEYKTYEWDNVINDWREEGPAIYIDMSKVKTFEKHPGVGAVAFNSKAVWSENTSVHPGAAHNILKRGESPNGEILIYIEEDGYRIPKKKEDRPTLSREDMGRKTDYESVLSEINALEAFVDDLESQPSQAAGHGSQYPSPTTREMAEDALRDYRELLKKRKKAFSSKERTALRDKIDAAEKRLRQLPKQRDSQIPAHGVRRVPAPDRQPAPR